LNLGELLDRTFQIYRTHFQLFAGMAAVGSACTLVWSAIQIFTQRGLASHGLSLARIQYVNLSLQLVAVAIGLIVSSLIWGAMVQAVAAIYRRQEVGIASALRALLPKWFRLAFVTLTAFLVPWVPVIAGFAVMLVMLGRASAHPRGQNVAGTFILGAVGLSFLIFVPLGIWLSLRYVLANAACAYEGTSWGKSLKRSVLLSKGMRGRLFLLVLVAVVMQMVISAIFSIPMWIPLFRHPQHPPLWTVIYSLIAGFFSGCLTSPVLGIGVALFYFDARIRKEGLDIEWSLQPELPIETVPELDMSHADPSAG
jgi:hypothetical protein